MRADAMDRLQMLGMHQQPRKIIFVIFQPKQDAESDVVDAAVHSAVHRFGMVRIIVLRTRGVELLIAFLVIGLLKQDICADARFLQPAVVFHGGGGYVYIHAADVAVLVMNAVYGMDAFEDIVNRVMDGVFARLDGKTLVALVLERDDLGTQFLLRQLFPRYVLVLRVIGTVYAAVYAVI